MRDVLRREIVREKGGRGEIGKAGSNGRGFSITKAQLSVRDSTGLSVHTPLSAGHSQSNLRLTLLD